MTSCEKKERKSFLTHTTSTVVVVVEAADEFEMKMSNFINDSMSHI